MNEMYDILIDIDLILEELLIFDCGIFWHMCNIACDIFNMACGKFKMTCGRFRYNLVHFYKRLNLNYILKYKSY